MLIGYGRVSNGKKQDDTQQVRALEAAGCERIFSESASGGKWDRTELHSMLNQLREGDVVIVWRLDRLSRSLRDMLTILEIIDKAGAGFRSLTEPIDTTSPAGRMMIQMVATFAEYEREMLRIRTREGMVLARANGKLKGKQPKLSAKQQKELWRMHDTGGYSITDLADVFAVSRPTVYRTLTRKPQ